MLHDSLLSMMSKQEIRERSQFAKVTSFLSQANTRVNQLFKISSVSK